MFIKTEDYTINFANVTRIELIDPERQGEYAYRVWFVGMQDHVTIRTTSELNSDRLNETAGIIPAEPGYWLLKLGIYADGDCSLYKYPIIAWLIRKEQYSSEPITVTGQRFERNSHDAILQPDGKVVNPGNYDFNKLDDWLEFKRSQLAKHASWEKD